jgi:hypothetical protein
VCVDRGGQQSDKAAAAAGHLHKGQEERMISLSDRDDYFPTIKQTLLNIGRGLGNPPLPS